MDFIVEAEQQHIDIDIVNWHGHAGANRLVVCILDVYPVSSQPVHQQPSFSECGSCAEQG